MKSRFRRFWDSSRGINCGDSNKESLKKSGKRIAKWAIEYSRRILQRLSWGVRVLDLRHHSVSLAFDGDIFSSKMMVSILSQCSIHVAGRVTIKA